MELAELAERLVGFVRAVYDDPCAQVSNVHAMPGHAGFSYGFTATSRDASESWFLRMPPPNVNWRGTADVLRQVAALHALEGTSVPHCRVRWSGDDLQWFGRPYFVVPQLEGDVLRLGPNDWGAKLDEATRRDMARQAMTALAEIHRVDWKQRAPYLGDPIPFGDDVTRWDRFMNRVAEPERLAQVPHVRELLLAKLPTGAPIGMFHGDFQWSNLFFSFDAELLAVIDWELVGVGATLNDVGWIATFNDPEAWAEGRGVTGQMLGPDTLIGLYAEAWAHPLPDLNWFRALAAYKFAIITGFNLGLHRRGKRPDPLWEQTAESMLPLIERARELLEARA
jgi:aminoglycoside phosphotransferase (APT) family kinase protein